MVGKEARRADLGAVEGGIALPRIQALLRRQRRARHLPAAQHDAGQLQVRDAAGKHRLHVRLDIGHHILDHLLERRAALLQALRDGREIGVLRLAQLTLDIADLRDQRPGHGAAIAHRLAAHQVVGLDRRRAFVDGQDLGIAVVLRRARFFDEAHAAVHLHAVARDLLAHLGRPALDDRDQVFIDGQIRRARRFIRMVMGQVGQRRADIRQRARSFRLRTHRHQHAAHVRVVDDRHRTARAGHVARLDAVLGKGHGALVRVLGQADALDAHAEARCIHHDEHVFEATVFFADQRADGPAVVAELQHGRWAGLDAQLVFDRDAGNVVARAQRAIVVDHELGHDEQRDPLHARRRVRRARQHQVHDVLGHVVIAIRDVDLGAEQFIGAIALRLGAGAHGGQVGAGLRLGQVHGAGPPARYQRLEEARLLRVRAGGEQGLDGAVGQQRHQRERQVGAVQHLHAGRGHELGQALPAEVLRMLHALPAGLGVRLERLAETLGRGDGAVFPVARVLVAHTVERRDHVAAEFRVLFQDRFHGVGRRIFTAGQRIDLGQVGQFGQHELHVFQRGVVAHHCLLNKFLCKKNAVPARAGTASLAAVGAAYNDAAPGDQPSSLTSSGTASNRSPTRP